MPYLERAEKPSIYYEVADRTEAIRKSISEKNIKHGSFPTEYHSVQFTLPVACTSNVLHFITQRDIVPFRE
jgi:hypothetical protein